MRHKLLILLGILFLVGVLAQSNETKAQGSKPPEDTQSGKWMIEKCSACNHSILLRLSAEGELEMKCPDCSMPMRTEQTAASRMVARCTGCTRQVEMRKVDQGKLMVKCPGCDRELIMKCPDCGNKGAMKVNTFTTVNTKLECKNCHKQVEMK